MRPEFPISLSDELTGSLSAKGFLIEAGREPGNVRQGGPHALCCCCFSHFEVPLVQLGMLEGPWAPS